MGIVAQPVAHSTSFAEVGVRVLSRPVPSHPRYCWSSDHNCEEQQHWNSRQQGRQRQWKRHLQIDIWEMVTILWLLLPCIFIVGKARCKWTSRSVDEVNIENERFTVVCFDVVVKTVNLEISRCHLAGYVKEFYLSARRTCSTIIFPHSTNQIIVFWRRRCRYGWPCLGSLLA